MLIDHNVATAVKNFLKNYAEILGLPSPGKSVTVKPEITHTLGGHQFLWVITGYGFSQV